MKKHISLIIENNIKSNNQWEKHYDENRLKEKGYIRSPVRVFNKKIKDFNKTIKQFFEEIFSTKTEKEHLHIIKENNITNKRKWMKYWQDNNLKEQNYLCSPWKYSNKSIKEFFEQIWGAIKTEEEHIQLIKENNIKSNRLWNKFYEENNLKKQKYYSAPWGMFNKTVKQFFSQIK